MIFLQRPKDFSPVIEVVSCFLERDGKFLLLHRQDHKPQGNTWGVPAGKVEKGEALEAALVRELQEEIDYTIDASLLAHKHTVYVQWPGFDFIYHIYAAPFSNGQTVNLNSAEHKDFVWVTPEESLKMDLIPDEDACIKLCYGMG